MKIYSIIGSVESLCGCDGGPDYIETFETIEDARAKLREIVSGYDTIEGLNYKNIFTGPMETFKAAFKALQLCLPGSSEPFAWDRSAPNPEYTYTEHWWEEGGTVFFGEPMEGCGSANVTYSLKAMNVKPASKGKRKAGKAEEAPEAKRLKTGAEEAVTPPRGKKKGKGKGKGEDKTATGAGTKAKKAKASPAQ